MKITPVLVFSILAVACGGGQAETLDQPAPTSTTTAPEAEPATETTEVSVSTTESMTTTTEAPRIDRDLESALLELADMPEGWTISPDDDDPSDPSAPQCEQDLGAVFEGYPRTEVAYQESDFGPYISQSLVKLGSDNEADLLIDEWIEVVDRCQTYVDSDGNTLAFGPLNLDERGDRTFALRLSVSSEFFPAAADYIVVRDDAVVMAFVNLAFGATDFELTSEYLDLAVERLADS